MNPRTWKREESWWAERYEGNRNPIVGRNDIPDVENNQLALEIKMSKTNVSGEILRKAIEQSDRAAKTTDKLPIVGVSLPGIKREGLKGRPPRERYVFLREDIFHAFWKDYLQEAK